MTTQEVEIEQKVKETVVLIVRQLNGFSQWEALHILECVKEELGGILNAYPINSSDFTISS